MVQIIHNLSLITKVLKEALIVALYILGQIQFQLGFNFLNLFPASYIFCIGCIYEKGFFFLFFSSSLLSTNFMKSPYQKERERN